MNIDRDKLIEDSEGIKALKELMRCFNWHNGYDDEDKKKFFTIVHDALVSAHAITSMQTEQPVKRFGLSNKQMRIIEFANGDYVKYDDYIKAVSTNTDGWVSVDERLPDIGVNILASFIRNGKKEIIITSRNDIKFSHDTLFAWALQNTNPITHWHALPSINAISQDKGESV